MSISSNLSDLIAATAGNGDLIYIVQGGNSRKMTLGTVGAQLLADTGYTGALTSIGVTAFGRSLLDDTGQTKALATLGVTALGRDILNDTGQTKMLTTLGGGAKGRAIFQDTGNTAVLTELGFSALMRNLRGDTGQTAALTTLGGTSVGRSLFTAASASAALTTLGVSTFMKSVLDDTGGSTAIATLGVSSQVEAEAATINTKIMTPLRVGQTIDGRTTKIGDANSVARTIPARFGDTIDIEEYLVGDGTTFNNTQMTNLITYMTANPQKVYRSRPGRVFKLSAGGWAFPDNITLNTEGAEFQLAGTLADSTAFIETGDNNRIDALIAEVLTGHVLKRGIFVSGGCTIGTLKITSADQQANTGALTFGGIRLNGSDISVGEAIVSGFDYAFRIYADGASGVRESISVKSLRVDDYVTGAYVRNISGVSINDYIIKGRSANALPDPGHNGVVLEGVEYARFTSGTIRDAGEHGFRSGGFRDATAGTGTFVALTRQLSVDTLQVNSAGQCGFKIWSGDTGQVHKDISINNIQCVDNGDDGDAHGFNDFGFMLQNIDGLNATGCTSSSRDETFGSYDGWYLHGLSRSQLAGCRSYDAARRGMTISEYSDGSSLDALGINSLDISNFVTDQQVAAGIYLDFPGSSSLRDIMITNAHVITCTNGVETNAATGRFVQPCFISAFVRGASGSRFSVVETANLKTVDLFTAAGSATYDPGSLADGVGATTTVTATGAALGDSASATFSLDLQGITLTAWVSAANTVSVRFQNESGGTLDLASGTLRVRASRI